MTFMGLYHMHNIQVQQWRNQQDAIEDRVTFIPACWASVKTPHRDQCVKIKPHLLSKHTDKCVKGASTTQNHQALCVPQLCLPISTGLVPRSSRTPTYLTNLQVTRTQKSSLMILIEMDTISEKLSQFTAGKNFNKLNVIVFLFVLLTSERLFKMLMNCTYILTV